MYPRFSIIIPVVNEKNVINETITHVEEIAHTAGAAIEIIVVDGDRDGKTIGVIRHHDVKTAISEKGRGTQMNCGAAMAKGDIVVFLHADTCLPAGCFSLMEAALCNPKYIAGAFDLSFDSERLVFRLIAKIASWRSRLTRIPYGDQAFFFTRNSFATIGGFADIPLMEDVEIMRRIKKRREHITIVKGSVTTSQRRWEKDGIMLCTLRNWLLITLYLVGVSPKFLSGLYK